MLHHLFKNKQLRLGGFYELSIQVCPSLIMSPITEDTNYIKSLKNVDGPYNKDFELKAIEVEGYEHEWILNLENHTIPFKTFNIRESQPLETGFNWFDICFYTAAIEQIFGLEYQTWSENPNCPIELNDFFNKTLVDLNNIYKFQMAMIDFEISGQYYLTDLYSEINNWTHSRFFINRENANLISNSNKNVVRIID